MNKERRRSELDIHPVLNERFSPRAFSDRAVSDEELLLLMEAARWAPSSYNEQPWRFLITRRGGEGHAELLGTLVSANRTWAAQAPILMLNMVSRSFQATGQENAHAWHDLGGAMAQLTAQATSMGMGLIQMAGFDIANARAAFAIPEHMDLVSVLAIGFPSDPEHPDPALNEREVRRSTRKGLDEFVHFGRFST